MPSDGNSNTNGWRREPFVNVLSDTLWTTAARSHEVTLLKANRYFGPRDGKPSELHDHWELGVVVQGQGTLFYKDNEELALAPGIAFIVPPQLAHGELSQESIDIIFFGLTGSIFTTGWDRDKVTSVSGQRLVELAEEVWLRAATHRNRPVGGVLDATSHLIVALFEERLLLGTPAHVDAKLSAVLEYMERHLSDSLTVTTLAHLMGVSDDHFRRRFKHQLGRTPIQHLNELRLRQARQLLQYSNLPLSEIARHCGYDDPFYFSRVFKRHTKCSPLRYRRQPDPL